MKKIIVLILMLALLVPVVFAYGRYSASITLSGDMDKIERFSLEGGDRLFARFSEDKKVSFSLMAEGVGGVSFCNYDENEPHVHLDVSVSLLPGVSIMLGDSIFLNAAIGPKYSRIGYSGNIETASGWDKLLSIVTLGLMGSHPLRKVDVALDVNIQLAFLAIGVTASFPVVQGCDSGYKQGLYASVYGSIDLKY